MPRKKKENNFIPLDEDDAKHAIEIVEKPKPTRDEIEKVEYTGKTKATKQTKKKEKTNDYTLVITEKPAAAAKIAYALSSSAKKLLDNKVPYYELEKKEKKIIVACAVGHLFSLTQKSTAKKSSYPVFDIEWQPNFKVRKRDFSKKYYNLLSKLVKNASDFIVATDYDIEGEVIGWNIVKFIAKQTNAKRMKFSTLTASELEKAYENASPTINWGQAIAGNIRHNLDWLYGINLSRALMEAIKTTGTFRIMSIGRVQGPALHLVVEREKQIQAFKSKPYWQVFLTITNSHTIQVKYIKDITNKKLCALFKKLKGKKALASTEKKQQIILPPPPFDLTTLQTEAYKFFSITPSRTLQIAQQLYLAGLISYPRTSSQKLPPTIDYKKIINQLSKNFIETKFVKKAKPIEGKKSDPAHPAIYPTGNFKELKTEEEKIHKLIVARFISCFCDSAIIDNKIITVTYEKFKFVAKGIHIREKGWMNVYKAIIKELTLPDIEGEVTIKDVKIEEKQTQPPKRFSPASLVSELSKRNLGTKATRAAIVETLYNRNYIKERQIQATPLGMQLIQTLEKNSPIIINEELTRKFEQEMESIQTGKHNLEKKQEKTITEARQIITKISKEFKNKQEKIGKELLKANNHMWKEQQKENELMPCPVCKKGRLRILYNKKSRRYFLGCSAYPKCKTTFSLPPNCLIKKADKICECGFQKLLAIRKGKRPWEFCFNPECKQATS